MLSYIRSFNSFQLFFVSLVASAAASPQGYRLSRSYGPGFSPDSLAFFTNQQPLSNNAFTGDTSKSRSKAQDNSYDIDVNSAIANNKVFFTGTGPINYQLTTAAPVQAPPDKSNASKKGDEITCKDGEILHIDGTCVLPEITRRFFIFSVPAFVQKDPVPPRRLPVPKVEHNVLFVRLPETDLGPEPILVAPPRQNNIIYVLNKQSEQTQRTIELPVPPSSEPEIYFVNYKEGENPALPGGVDLHTVLKSANETGSQLIVNNDEKYHF